MEADIAIFLSEARFKANGGDFFAGADNRPSQSPGGPSALLQPPRLEETRKVEGETILNCRPPPRSSASVASHAKKPFFRNRVRNRLLIYYAPRFRGSGHERRRLHRIDAAKHMSRFYQPDGQQDLDDRRQFDRRTSRADVPERHLLTSLSILPLRLSSNL
jgi:hypothetical protein